MRKRQLPAWGACLLLIALTLGASHFLWLPITEDTGIQSVMVLERAVASEKIISLDFGAANPHRIHRSASTEALLDDSALGQEYRVTDRYHGSRRGSSRYYEVLALSGTDGRVYLTLEESEARRQAAMPARLALLVALDAAVCALLIWRDRQQRRSQSTNKKEASP